MSVEQDIGSTGLELPRDGKQSMGRREYCVTQSCAGGTHPQLRALSPGQDLELLAEALESVTKVFLTEIEACAATHRHICAGQHGELHRQRSSLTGLSRASYREGTTLPMRAYCRRCRGVGRTPRQAGTGSLTKLQFASYVMGVPWVVLYRNSLLEW